MFDKNSMQVYTGLEWNNSEDIIHSMKTLIDSNLTGDLLFVEPFGLKIETLDTIVDLHQNQLDTAELYQELRQSYFSLVERILGSGSAVLMDINDDFIEAEWTLEDLPEENPAFVKDQILTVLSIVSSKIIAAYFNQKKIACQWIDARDLFVGDNNYGNGDLLKEESKKRCEMLQGISGDQNALIITQGGIACTTENFNLTLGENGTDKCIKFLS